MTFFGGKIVKSRIFVGKHFWREKISNQHFWGAFWGARKNVEFAFFFEKTFFWWEKIATQHSFLVKTFFGAEKNVEPAFFLG